MGDDAKQNGNGHDTFFTDLANTKPYLKIAFEGFAGSGKTYTMAQLAAGLHKKIGSTKPIVIFDTEEAAKFLRRFFDGQGIKVLHKRSRSLADLLETMKRCREGASDVLMIDSISHVWEDFLRAFKEGKKKNKDRLTFPDWGILKPTWKRDFADPFVRDPYHCLMTGRAGFEYEDRVDDEGNKEIFKTGIKMKVEGETAYEPDLLVLMSRYEKVIGDDKSVWREATIIKDRSTLIDGKTFQNPTFADFVPSIDYILENPVDRPATERDAGQLFENDEEKRQFAIKRDILLEKVEAELVSAWAGSSADAKRSKVDALQEAFGTKSWTEVTKQNLIQLEAGLEKLVSIVGKAKAAQAEAAAN